MLLHRGDLLIPGISVVPDSVPAQLLLPPDKSVAKAVKKTPT